MNDLKFFWNIFLSETAATSCGRLSEKSHKLITLILHALQMVLYNPFE